MNLLDIKHTFTLDKYLGVIINFQQKRRLNFKGLKKKIIASVSSLKQNF